MSFMSVVSPSMLIALALAAVGVDGSKKARKALVDAIGDKSIALDYYAITGKRGEARRIPLDRSLVMWELDSPQP